MAQHVWEGHVIEVRFRLLPQVAWLGGGFIVRVDGGKEFLPPRGLEGRSTATRFAIEHAGREAAGVVQSVGRVRALGTPYEVRLDGSPVAAGRVRADNWVLPYTVFLALF